MDFSFFLWNREVRTWPEWLYSQHLSHHGWKSDREMRMANLLFSLLGWWILWLSSPARPSILLFSPDDSRHSLSHNALHFLHVHTRTLVSLAMQCHFHWNEDPLGCVNISVQQEVGWSMLRLNVGKGHRSEHTHPLWKHGQVCLTLNYCICKWSRSHLQVEQTHWTDQYGPFWRTVVFRDLSLSHHLQSENL